VNVAILFDILNTQLCVSLLHTVITGRLLIIYSAFAKYLREREREKKRNTMNQFISSLKTSRKLMIQLGGRSDIRFSLSLISLGNL